MARSEAQKQAEKNYEATREKRYRCWTLIFYPEGNPGAPDDWDERIAELHLKVWVSPIHDQDVWTASDERRNNVHKEGTRKKAHYHLVVEYPVQQKMADVADDFAFLNGTRPERVRDKNSMVRYLIHMDDPKKAQYERSEIRCFGGTNLDAMDELGTGELHQEMKAMRRCIKENNFVDFCLFYDYCDDCQEQWARLLDVCSTYAIERYIKSRRALEKQEAMRGGAYHDPHPGGNPEPISAEVSLETRNDND